MNISSHSSAISDDSQKGIKSPVTTAKQNPFTIEDDLDFLLEEEEHVNDEIEHAPECIDRKEDRNEHTPMGKDCEYDNLFDDEDLNMDDVEVQLKTIVETCSDPCN